MKNLNGKVAVITGAGSGIGRALAQNLAAKGCSLALSDVNEAGLSETRQLLPPAATCATWKVDVSDRSAMRRHAEDVIDKFGVVDIVINNAGVALAGNFEDNTYEEIEWQLGINLWGVIHGCKEFLPHLRERPEAALVNLSSIFGIVGMPEFSAYCMSKFAVRALNEALWQELADTSITVTSVHPGGIKTNIAKRAKVSEKMREERPEFQEEFEKAFITTPEKAAEAIVTAIRGKKKKVMVGIDAKIMEKIQRLAPTGYPRAVSLFIEK